MWEFKLSSEYIELDNLLKAMNLAPTGAQAKVLILANSVKVNGVVETRVRCKLRAGDLIEVGFVGKVHSDTILIV